MSEAAEDEYDDELGTTRVTLADGTKIVLPFRRMHQSAAAMYVKCPRQFWFRYVMGIKGKPEVFFVAGQSGHKALEINNKHKIKKGDDLSSVRVVEAFEDTFSDRAKRELKKADWTASGLTDASVRDSIKKPLAQYMISLAPAIEPVGAEQRLDGTFFGVPMGGSADLVEDRRVTDYKFCSGRSPYLKPYIADHSLQLGIYAALLKKDKAGFIAFNKDKRTVHKVPTTTPKDRRIAAKKQVVQIARGISAGSFPMCDPNNFLCSARFCSYWSRCRGASKRANVLEPK